jgi:hypothetical protein
MGAAARGNPELIRHAFEALLPARTALVVIDMVPFFVSGGGYCLGIVPHISSIAGALRRAGGTVAWVVPAAPDRMAVSEEFYGPEVAAAFRRSGGDGPVADRIWKGWRRLDVIVANLVGNAVRHSESLVTIRVSAGPGAHGRKELAVEVPDHGPWLVPRCHRACI